MDPLYFERLAEPTVRIYEEIETQILINIAKALRKNKSLLTPDGYAAWQAEQLDMLDSLTQEHIQIIAKHAGMAPEKVKEAIEEAGQAGMNQYEDQLQQAAKEGVLPDTPKATTSQALGEILLSYQNQATSRLNYVNTSMLSGSQQVYLDIINKSVGKVLAGVQTADQAMRGVVREWSQFGIPVLEDRAGRKWSAEAYLNMNIRSTVSRVAREMQFQRMSEYGVDLIEVSSHLGARPKCAPYQGRIYSLSGKHPRYPAWSTTSYGDPGGLLGVNCRHSIYPFIEGITKKRFRPYSESQNEKMYKLQQQQRKLERNIRKAKRELRVMEALGDEQGIQEAKQKVRLRQAQMREFIAETGLTRRRKREQIV